MLAYVGCVTRSKKRTAALRCVAQMALVRHSHLTAVFFPGTPSPCMAVSAVMQTRQIGGDRILLEWDDRAYFLDV